MRLLLATVILLLSTLAVTAEGPSPAHTALGRLKLGNEKFAKNASAPVSLSPRTRQSLVTAEQPFAMVVSCADSRVPPEYIFNAGLGELFVVRTAGAVMDKSVLATLEYGAEHLTLPLMVVMGHDSCDVVKATVESQPLTGPNLDYLVAAIRAGTTRTPAETMELRGAILANVEQVINDALAGSEILRNAVNSGALQIVGAYYELASGRVMFSEPAAGPGDGTTAPVVAPAPQPSPAPAAKPASTRRRARRAPAPVAPPEPRWLVAWPGAQPAARVAVAWPEAGEISER